MDRLSQQTIERMVNALSQEIASSCDVMRRLELIQNRIALRSVLNSQHHRSLSR